MCTRAPMLHWSSECVAEGARHVSATPVRTISANLDTPWPQDFSATSNYGYYIETWTSQMMHGSTPNGVEDMRRTGRVLANEDFEPLSPFNLQIGIGVTT